MAALGPSDPAPRSDAPAPATANADPFARPATTAADPNELKPDATPAPNATAPPDPNELKPQCGRAKRAGGRGSLPPPVQVNEIQQSQASSGQAANANDSAASSTSASNLASDQDVSTSKKKKKKGLKENHLVLVWQ